MKGMRRQRVVECGIEDRDLGDLGKPRHGSLDPKDVGGIVKRGQGHKGADRFNDTLVDHGWFPEGLTPVDHPVADAEKLGIVLNNTVFPVDGGHEVEAVPVIGQRFRTDLLVEASLAVAACADAESLQSPLSSQ